ncbi:MAG: ferritin-like domain-containing protein [Chthoniobacterales bacterium]
MDKAAEIIAELQTSYAMELETFQNYLANSVFLDGAPAEKIKRSLAGEIEIVLRHARQIAKRIKVLGGRVPGSLELSRNQDLIQPPLYSTDFISVIKGVIHVQEAAITQYQKIIKLCDAFDFVTQDIIIELVSDEREHRRRFLGFLAEHTGHLTQEATGD